MNFSSLLPFLIGGVGFFLLFKLKFFFIFHPIRVVGDFISALRSQGAVKALWLALAGTLGVGNIFGTAAGIMIGGAGSVFWLLLSSVFSSVLKYSETALTLELKNEAEWGFQSVLPKIFTCRGRLCALFYSLFCLLLSFLMGSAIQSAAVSDILSSAIDLPKIISAFILCALLSFGIIGGIKGIERVTAILVPFASVVFMLLCLVSLFVNIENIPSAVGRIISEAFSSSAVCGGALGFLCSKSISEGFARGILSNEAGIGTSAMAHSRADKRTPYAGGLFGIAEVVFDTVVLCGLTALALLSTSIDYSDFVTPMSYVFSAFKHSLGPLAAPLLVVSIVVFAYSTMICWYYYGSECTRYIFGNTTHTFTVIFFISALCGGLLGAGSLLIMTDTVIFFMALITLSTLLKAHKRIYSLTPILSETKSRRK